MKNYYIGIDIGTTNIKSVLFDRSFNQVFASSIPNETIYPQDGWCEQNMNEVFNKTILSLKNLTNDAGVDVKDIKAIGISGQGEGAWLVDQNGNPVRNAIIWSDTRASSVINKIDHDLIKALACETGSEPQPGNMSMILKWLSDNEPETLAKASYSVFAKDWIRFGLTGRMDLELSDVGTSIINLKTQSLSDLVFEQLHLNACSSLFPQIKNSTEIAGKITDDVARRTGLSAETVVVMGGVDVSCAALGLGACEEGDVFSILGTTCCTGVISKVPDIKGEGLRCIPNVVSESFIDLIATLSGTPNLDWAIENLSCPKDFKEIEALISSVSVGAGGVWYHPYIGGERAPFLNTNARASFFGISQGTTQAHLLRAVFEGISYTIKDALQGHPKGEFIYLAGGGSNSKSWLQIIADMTDRTVIVPGDKEISAKGAAMLAGIAVGDLTDIHDDKYFNLDEKIEPIQANVIAYERLYSFYKEFRIKANDLWNLRADIRRGH
ncbi:FGGY-family carbohydrate kinase [Vibrio gazogenes]|uniref:Xylulokinase n=3 Tax=Vibrio gazogenes TaxID=687 RepID=A0A1M5BPV1_VIBGA|nr:FGGY-family carbohydrate kinase [Vibrio gazogenes]USP13716.1 carbohydrate kinase [Vibrio gazogenes]SHF44277.1 xylulokinase [Vibrio gazogenes DSM 21264] [Vibrio gazogenes DSM 21264 = NBRC 103151]